MNDAAFVFIIIVWVGLSALSGIIGMNRRIGFIKAFAASFFLTPLIGIIMSCTSKPYEDIEREESILAELKRINGASVFLFMTFLLFSCKKKDTCTTCTTYRAIYNSSHTSFHWQAEKDTILCDYSQAEISAYISKNENAPDIDVTCQ